MCVFNKIKVMLWGPAYSPNWEGGREGILNPCSQIEMDSLGSRAFCATDKSTRGWCNSDGSTYIFRASVQRLEFDFVLKPFTLLGRMTIMSPQLSKH